MAILGTFNGASIVAVPTSPGFSAVQFDMNDSVALVDSPFTGQTQTQQWPGADRWTGVLTLPPLTQPQADQWISFLMELRGMANAFQLGDPFRTSPNGIGCVGSAMNFFSDSTDFTNTAAWVLAGVGTALPIYLGAGGPPPSLSGSSQAFSWPAVPSGHLAFTQITQTVPIGILPNISGVTYTFSVWIYSGTTDTITLYLVDNPQTQGINQQFTLGAGAWTRISVTFAFASTPSTQLSASIRRVGGQSANSYITMYGPQLEIGSTPTAVNQTTSIPVLGPVVDMTTTGTNYAGSQTLYTRGWKANTAGILLPGDYIQVGYRLHRVLDPVNSDINGKAAFSVWPSLRDLPTDNEPIALYSPTGLFRLSSNKRTWNVGQSRTTRLSVPFQEFR